ncbi:MAG: GNAT family N-acetyltransferase [Acidimicrobiia bacterium]|nr:GNAT family N-acetyltransferase [Acidimicrobiia bacterium]
MNPADALPVAGLGRVGGHRGPTTVVCNPCTDERWSDLVESAGHLFQSGPWLRVLRDAYGLSPKAVLVEAGGIAWVDVDDLRGRRRRSLPFSDFAGPVGSTEPRAMASVLASVWDQSTPISLRIPVERPDDRPGPDDDLASWLGLAEQGLQAWHWTDVRRPDSLASISVAGPCATGDVDAAPTAWEETEADPMWTALSPKARQNIRRARRSGVEVGLAADQPALTEFRLLHQRLRRRKYGLLAQPQTFFDALHTHFGPDRLSVVSAGVDGRLVAGVLLLRHRDRAYYKFNASNADGWATRANDLVMWAALRQARRWGCGRLDLGVSDLDQPGLVRYKDKYATGRGVVVEVGCPAGQPTWREQRVDRLLSTMTRMLTAERCPEMVAERASRHLYRLFC